MAFDPSKPFDVVGERQEPSFDVSKPYSVVEGEQADLINEMRRVRSEPKPGGVGAQAGFGAEMIGPQLRSQTGRVIQSAGKALEPVFNAAETLKETHEGMSEAMSDFPVPDTEKEGLSGLQKKLFQAVLGADNAVEAVGEKMAEKAQGELNSLNERADMVGGPSFARELVSGAGSLAPSLAAAPLGFPAMVAMAGLQGFGAHMSTAIDNRVEQGMSEEEAYNDAFLDSLAVGASTALLTRLFGATGVERLARLGLSPVARGKAGSFIAGILKNAGLEGAEEASQQMVEGMIEKARSNPDKTWNQIMSESLKAGLIGSILGGGVTTLTQTAEAVGQSVRGGEAGAQAQDNQIVLLEDQAAEAQAIQERMQAKEEGAVSPPPIPGTADDITANIMQAGQAEPTQAQKEAGNYKKDHVKWNGLDISIENRAGTERSGTDRDGKPWSVTMPAHYGYIKRTEGNDGDHVDIYIGDLPDSQRVFVVDQVNADTGKFDEHKVIAGVSNQAEAEALYDAGFSDGRGPERRSAITEMTVDEFKTWLKKGSQKKEASKQPPPVPREDPSEGKPVVAMKGPDGKSYKFRVEGTSPTRGPIKANVLMTPIEDVPGVPAVGGRQSTISDSQLRSLGYETPGIMDVPSQATLPEEGATRVRNVAAVVQQALGVEELPPGITILYEPGSPFPAFYEDGKVFLNAAHLSTKQEVMDALLEEGLHGVWQTPELQSAWQTVKDGVTEEDIEQEKADRPDTTDRDELVEEAAVRKIVEGKGDLEPRQGFWRSIFSGMKRLLGVRVAPISEQLREAALKSLKEGGFRKTLRYAKAKHQAHGQKFTSNSTTMNRQDLVEAGSAYAYQKFKDSGFNVTLGPDGSWVVDEFDRTDISMEDNLRKLLDEVAATQEMARQGALPDMGFRFFDSVRRLAEDQKLRAIISQGGKVDGVPDENYQMSGITTDMQLIDDLMVSAHRPHRDVGQMMNMMVRDPQDVLHQALHYKTSIADYVDQAFMPRPGATDSGMGRQFIDSVRGLLGEHMTEADVQEVMDAGFIEDLQSLLNNQRNVGSPVYRMVQSKLSPKKPPKLITLLQRAENQEAAEHIVKIALDNGVPLAPKHKGLSATDKLIHMSKPEVADKIEAAVEEAVRQAERNAARPVWANRTNATQEDLDLYDQSTLDPDVMGPIPSPSDVETGLNDKKHRHWKVIRKQLLDYSPVTEKLMRDSLKDSFKNLQFEETVEDKLDAPDTRISITELAKQPRAEIARVIDNYIQLLSTQMAKEGSPLKIRARLIQDLQFELMSQIQKQRQKIIDHFMAQEDVAPKPARTPDEVEADKDKAYQKAADKMSSVLNALQGVDVNVSDLVHKRQVQRLLPSMNSIIKKIFDTPVDQQAELATNFVNELMTRLNIDPDIAARARDLFTKAYTQKFKEARLAALEKAFNSMSPEEKEVLNSNGVGLYKWLVRAVRSGLLEGSQDSDSVLMKYAESRGWRMPTPNELERFHKWIEKEQSLREPTASQRKKAAGDQEMLDYFRAERIRETAIQRQALINKIEAQMKSWAKPIADNPFQYFQDPKMRENTNRAMQEWLVSNILTRFGGMIRQALDVTTVGLWYVPTRSMAHTWNTFNQQLAAGQEPDRRELFSNMASDMQEALKARMEAARGMIARFKMGLEGRGIPKHIESLDHGMTAVERGYQKAQDLREEGKVVQSYLVSLWNLQALGFRVFGAFDAAQHQSAEWQEIRSQARNWMRQQQGMTSAEVDAKMDEIFGMLNEHWAQALADAQLHMDETGEKLSDSEIKTNAWNLVVHRALAKLGELGAPVDNWDARNENYGRYLGWNFRPGGPGGVISKAMRGMAEVANNYIPFPMAAFGNAIGISLNRSLTWAGGGLMPKLFGNDPGYAEGVDKLQRRIEAIAGLSVGLPLAALAAMGAITVRLGWPSDEKEREEWRARGITPYTVEFGDGDGKALKVPLRIGPLAPMAGLLAFGGAMNNAVREQQKRRDKMIAEADRLGLPVGELPSMSAGDMLGAAGSAAWAMMTGGRTAAGMLGAYSNYGQFDSKRMAASFVGPLVPMLPAYQELSRMAGISVDPKKANFFQLLVPLPTSPQRVNMLGDKVATENDLERIFGMITLGGGVTKDTHKNVAYSNLFATDYRPERINPAQGYNFGGVFRPMTTDELHRYTVLRGKLFKEKLTELGPVDPNDPASRQLVSQAFRAAKMEALARVGVTLPDTGRPTRSSSPALPANQRRQRSRTLRSSRYGRAPGRRSTGFSGSGRQSSGPTRVGRSMLREFS